MKKGSSTLSFLLNKFLFPGTAFFTLITLFLSLSLNAKGITTEKLWVICFLSFGISAANLLFRIEKLNLYFKLSTHFIALAGILLATMYMTGYMKTTSSWVIVLIAFVLLYAIIAPIAVFKELRKRRKQKTDKSYTSIYGDKK